MGHTLVTRVSLGLAALLVAASFAFAWRAHRSAARETPLPERLDGERLFARRCAACHAPGEWDERFRDAAAAEGAVIEMLELLADHGQAGAAEDLAILAHLRGRVDE